MQEVYLTEDDSLIKFPVPVLASVSSLIDKVITKLVYSSHFQLYKLRCFEIGVVPHKLYVCRIISGKGGKL